MPSGGQVLQLTFDTCRDDNVQQLRQLNSAIFPIKYSDRMYQEILACGPVTQLAYHSSSLIGAIGCRLENTPEGVKMYIMTLGVLAPYRGLGIGSTLLARSLSVLEELPEVGEAYLHVQTSNEDAIRFYQRAGFEVGETIPNYYRRLDPPDAVVLRKVLQPAGGGEATAAAAEAAEAEAAEAEAAEGAEGAEGAAREGLAADRAQGGGTAALAAEASRPGQGVAGGCSSSEGAGGSGHGLCGGDPCCAGCLPAVTAAGGVAAAAAAAAGLQ